MRFNLRRGSASCLVTRLQPHVHQFAVVVDPDMVEGAQRRLLHYAEFSMSSLHWDLVSASDGVKVLAITTAAPR